MKIRAKLGDVLHRSGSSGNLIVKLEAETHIGEPVYDRKGTRVGTVFDIFGPVKTPFASVRTREDEEETKHKALFLGEGKSQGRPRDRSRRRRNRS
jgi:rRNA processing protein Gar1